MDRRWFYFDNYVYVNYVAPNKVLLYNTLNHDMLTYQNDGIYAFVKELTSIENNNIMEVEWDVLHEVDPDVYGFIVEARNHYMGDLLPVPEHGKKPVVFQSEPMILREGHSYYYQGDSILHNITEMTFYINETCPFDCRLCDRYYKQAVCCHKGDGNKELSCDAIITCLDSLQEASLFKVNITGGNILAYGNLDKLVEKLNGFSFKKVYMINTKHITDIEKIYPILQDSRNTIELLCTDRQELENGRVIYTRLNSENVQINFFVQSADDLNWIETFCKGQEQNINLTPFYNGDNYEFFQENIFVSKEEIKQVSYKSIKRNSILNNCFFGSLVCMPNGDIHSNLNDSSLGNIEKQSVVSMVFKELEEGGSWLRIRKNAKPCNECLYASMCPPLSNYEQAMGKNDLCTIIK